MASRPLKYLFRIPLFLSFLIVFLSGCDRLTVNSPSADGVYPDPPAFSVSYTQSIANFAATLNGVDVSANFTVSGRNATAEGADLADLLQDGVNLFVVSAPAKKTVKFFYDLSGPVVHVTGMDGNIVSGYMEDPGGTVSLVVNSSSVTLGEGDTFSVDTGGGDFTEFVAEDSFGQVSTTVFARAGLELVPSISARVNRSGLDFVIDEIEQIVADIDFSSIITALNPLFDEDIFVASARVNATGMSIGQPDVQLAIDPSNNNQFDAHIEVPNLRVDVSANGTAVFIPWSASGNVTANNAVFDALVTVGVSGGNITVGISNVSTNLQGFDFNINNFPGALESLFNGLVEGIVEGLVNDQLEARVPELLAGFLDDLPIDDIQLPIADVIFRVNAIPDSLATYSDGITVGLGGSITAVTDGGVAPTLGSRYVGGAMPQLGTATPSGTAFDAGAVVQVGLINQALLAAYESGLTHFEIGPSSEPVVTPAAVAVIPSADDVVASAEELSFNIVPSSPAYVSLLDGSDSLASLHVDDFVLEFSLKQDGSSEFVAVFGATVNVDAVFDLGVTEENFLDVEIVGLPVIEVLSVTETGLINLSASYIEELINSFVPVALPEITQAIESVPIPSFEGYSIFLKDIWAADAELAYVALAGDLIKVATTEAAAAPSTYAAVGVSSAAQAEVSDGRSVTIYLDGDNPTDQPLQYRYRLNGGQWSIWKARESIALQKLLGGDHQVDVCSRTHLLKQDPECTSVEFSVGN